MVFSIILGIIIVLLWNNSSLSFWDQDESSYAGFAYNMIHNDDFITPQFTWAEPHRKTPFHFWAIALSYQVFGINEFAVRFPSLLAVLLTSASVFFLGKRIFGKDISLAGALILLSSIMLPSLGKIAVTDAILLLFETIAILALFRFIQHPNFKDAGFLFLGLSGGMVVKGPPVVMLVGIAGVALLVIHPNRFRLLNYKLILAVLFSFAPILIWGRLAWLNDDGVFVTFLLDHYIINRAKGGTFANQTGPPGYYLVIFVLSFLFWLPLFFGGLRDMFVQTWGYLAKKLSFGQVETNLLLFCWCMAGWFLYEPIKSKLPAYAIGAYPAVSLIIASYAIKMENLPLDRWVKVFGWVQLVLTVIASIAFGVAFYLLIGTSTLPVTVGLGLSFITVTTFALYYLSRKETAIGFKLAFFNAFLFLFLGWAFLVPLLEPNRSISKRTTAIIDKNLSKEGKVVFSKNFYLPSFPFYVLQTGRKYAANEPTNEELLVTFLSKEKVAIVFDQERWQQFKVLLPPIDNSRVKEVDGWALDMAKQTRFTILFN